MLISEAHVETERPSRYLVQLCRHLEQMGRPLGHRPRSHGGGDMHAPPEVQHVEWSETSGTVHLNWGQWTMRAAPGTLTLCAEAANENDLRQIQDLVAGRLEKIGRRDHLTVTWQRSEAPGIQPEADQTDAPHPEEELPHAGSTTRRWSLHAIGGVAALAVGAHLVLGGSVLAASRWLGWGAGAIALAVILVKVIGVGSLAALRGHRRAR